MVSTFVTALSQPHVWTPPSFRIIFATAYDNGQLSLEGIGTRVTEYLYETDEHHDQTKYRTNYSRNGFPASLAQFDIAQGWQYVRQSTSRSCTN